MQDHEVKKVVEETLTTLGFDIKNPIEVQKDIASLRELRKFIASEDTQADLVHLRKWREAMDNTRSYGLRAFMFALVSGLIATLWIGFKHTIK